MLETLDYINRLEYRPACAHALTDQLLPNVATYQALELTGFEDQELADKLQEQIQEDIVRLQELQQTLGGWSWCYSEHDDPILSAYALLSLAKAQEAGFTVSSDQIGKGGRYLQREIGDVIITVATYEVLVGQPHVIVPIGDVHCIAPIHNPDGIPRLGRRVPFQPDIQARYTRYQRVLPVYRADIQTALTNMFLVTVERILAKNKSRIID